MKKVYIDVTNLLQVNFISGIQRVTINIIKGMVAKIPNRLILLSYSNTYDEFIVVDNDKFYKKYIENEININVFTPKTMKIKDISSGDIFFDIDAVWNLPYKRSSLLPELKKYGIKSVVYIYDIIPIRYPQFCHINTIYNFLDYIGAYMQYADLMIASTKTVLNDIRKLASEIGIDDKKGDFSWLGSDFVSKDEDSEEKIDKDVIEKIKNKKYILCVGTIEPRKNLNFVFECFEKYLFEKNVNLVFAGRIGWNVEKFKKKIQESKYNGEKFFHFEGMNDETIDYVYKNSLAVAFPTYDEGFGLPLIEAFERGVPVIASDIEVSREVAGDLADYFTQNSEEEFVNLVEKYVNDKKYYDDKKKNLKNYKRVTWEETTDKILDIINNFENEKKIIKKDVKQMVILTARADVIGKTLVYVDNLMPFIKEVVLCCPKRVKNEMINSYKGRLKITILTDEELLENNELPKDHVVRNTYLRALALKTTKIDDVFIMSDDDYRPLKEVSLDYYINNEKYIGYYFYNIDEWRGTVGEMTSYDIGMKMTAEFLKENNYSLQQYSSHMPQIIDKEIYLEMLERHKEIETRGVDEWSTYFNYLNTMYPEILEKKESISMCWPALSTDWDIKFEIEDYVFENYYDVLYRKNNIFYGHLEEYDKDKYKEDNEIKIKKYKEMTRNYIKSKQVFEQYKEQYRQDYAEEVSFGIFIKGNTLNLKAPKYLTLASKSFNRILFFQKYDSDIDVENIKVTYRIYNEKETVRNEKEMVLFSCTEIFPVDIDWFELPFWTIDRTGRYILELEVYIDGNINKIEIPLNLIKIL